MKSMNIDVFQREIDIAVVKATVTVIDRRTGKVENRDFFRFGQIFPIRHVEKELSTYGYDVLGYTDCGCVEGTLDFEQMYHSLEAVEAEVA